MTFSDHQIDALVRAIADGTLQCNETQAREFIDWAHGQTVGKALVDLCIEGKIVVEYGADEEFKFFSRKAFEEGCREEVPS